MKQFIFCNTYPREQFEKDCAEDSQLKNLESSITDGERELKELESDFVRLRDEYRKTRTRLNEFRDRYSESIKRKERDIKIRRRRIYARGKSESVRKIMMKRATEISNSVKTNLDEQTKEYEKSIRERI